MRGPVMLVVVVAAVACGQVDPPQTSSTAAPEPTDSASPLTLESAGCAEETLAELPSPESIREARVTNPDAFGPSRLRDLLEGNAAAAAETAGAAGSTSALRAQQWRELVDAFAADAAAQPAETGAFERFHYRVGGMEVHAVRIAEVWFLESETHAMPDSFCEDGEPDNLVDEAIELECEDPELTEHGEIDHEIDAPGISDDPFVVAQEWVEGNVLEPSQVSLGHIGDPDASSGPDVAVLRDGQVIVLLDLVPAEGGGLLVSSFSACPADLEDET